MTLATKNHVLILKEGKLAENCGCCEGWYCCQENPCYQLKTISVQITAQDFYCAKPISGSPFQTCSAVLGATWLSGSYVLVGGGNFYGLQSFEKNLQFDFYREPQSCCEWSWSLAINYLQPTKELQLQPSGQTPLQQLKQNIEQGNYSRFGPGVTKSYSGVFSECNAPLQISLTSQVDLYSPVGPFGQPIENTANADAIGSSIGTISISLSS